MVETYKKSYMSVNEVTDSKLAVLNRCGIKPTSVERLRDGEQ